MGTSRIYLSLVSTAILEQNSKQSKIRIEHVVGLFITEFVIYKAIFDDGVAGKHIRFLALTCFMLSERTSVRQIKAGKLSMFAG